MNLLLDYSLIAVVFLIVVIVAAIFISYRREPKTKKKELIFYLVIAVAGAFAGVFFAMYLTNLQTQLSEKRHLSGLIIQAKSENDGLILAIKTRQQTLKKQPQPGAKGAWANFEPYFKIEALDNVFKNPLFTAYCQTEAKELINPLTQLRISSFFAGGIFYNTAECHKEIDSHISNLEESNKLLDRCYKSLAK